MNDEIHAACRARQGDLSPEFSMGGINAFSHGCKTVGFTPGYAVCLHKMAAYERDGGLKAYPECEKAIRNKDCPAIAMRKEELVAGKALYFIDRNILREEMDKHFKAQVPDRTPAKAPSKFNTTKATPAPAPKVESDNRLMAMPEGDGYAAAINAAIAEANAATPVKEEPKVAAPSPSEQPKRPSLMELARMKMGNQTKEQS